MSVNRRTPRNLAVIVLAVPVIAAVYLTTVARHLIMLPRTLVTAVLGAAVISSVYADEAYHRAPDGVKRSLNALPSARVTPARAVLSLALAVALVGAGAPTAPATAAQPADAVIKAARSYLGVPYRLGATGPGRFDCSGFIYRIFKDAGELPRVSGKRLRAVGYLRWFSARGLASKRNGERGDLVVWAKGAHIGIYLGNGKVISALTNSGITVHGLHSINFKFTTFLKVQWKVGDGNGSNRNRDKNNNNNNNKDRDKNRDRDNGNENNETVAETSRGVEAELVKGLATGTMNLRRAADPDARIVGWVSRGSRFTITGTGNSPSGALWYSIEMRNGKQGWVFSRWVKVLEN